LALRTHLIHQSQYIGIRAVNALVQCFSREQNLHVAASIGSLFHRLNKKRCMRAEENIARCFPDWPRERVKDVAERSMQHMFQLFMVDTSVTPRLLTPDTWPQYVDIGNIAPLLDRLVRGKPAIMLTGHLGNWELLGQLLAVIGYPIMALARPLDNPLLNKYLLDIRQTRGTRIITKWGATPQLQYALQHGGRVGFIADQNAGDRGMFVPFFNRLASSYKSIGLMAIRYRVPIVVAAAHRYEGQYRYKLGIADMFGPEDWEDQPDPLFYITARFNRGLEQLVHDAPEQYLWLHRRWKSRPRHEREGKEPPAKLIAKLESLPWMTQELLTEVLKPVPPLK